MEVSANLGSHTWYNALNVAKNYNGGGFNDWYLPTKEELNLIYKNLVKTGILNDTTCHWSSSQPYNDYLFYACYQNFSNGYQGKDYTNSPNTVRAIRAF